MNAAERLKLTGIAGTVGQNFVQHAVPRNLLSAVKAAHDQPRAQPWADLNPNLFGAKHKAAKVVAQSIPAAPAWDKWVLPEIPLLDVNKLREQAKAMMFEPWVLADHFKLTDQFVGNGTLKAAELKARARVDVNWHAEVKAKVEALRHRVGLTATLQLPRQFDIPDEDPVLRRSLAEWERNNLLGPVPRLTLAEGVAEQLMRDFQALVEDAGTGMRNDLLAFNGWKRLGGGYYSSVYENRMYPGVVLKYGQSGTKDGAYAFYRWAKHNQQYWGVPTVLGLKSFFKDGSGEKYLFVTEKLHKVDMAMYEFDPRNFKGFTGGRYGSRPEKFIKFVTTPMDGAVAETWWNLQQINQDSSYLESTFGTKDLHSDNIMIRKSDGALFLTDPFSAE